MRLPVMGHHWLKPIVIQAIAPRMRCRQFFQAQMFKGDAGIIALSAKADINDCDRLAPVAIP